jgi:hypothetical protein
MVEQCDISVIAFDFVRIWKIGKLVGITGEQTELLPEPLKMLSDG